MKYMPYKAYKQHNIIVYIVLCGKDFPEANTISVLCFSLVVYLTCLFVDIGATLFEAFTRCSTRCKV